jgi:hypothetical protein
MNFHQLKNDPLLDPSNIRAEDGLRPNNRWNVLYEGIFIPCGFVLVLLFFVLAGMLINYLNSRYP